MRFPLYKAASALITVGAFMAFLTVSATKHGVIPLERAASDQLRFRDAGLASALTKHRLAVRKRLFSGVASWYGTVFDGQTTASGEVFDKDAMTACHPYLPFGTLVRVINLRTRKSVVVRINDRGLLTPERIIDLSAGAAERIGLLTTGTAPVHLEIVRRKQS